MSADTTLTPAQKAVIITLRYRDADWAADEAEMRWINGETWSPDNWSNPAFWDLQGPVAAANEQAARK